MVVRELLNLLTRMDPDNEVVVMLFTEDDMKEPFDILNIMERNNTTQIEISEVEM